MSDERLQPSRTSTTLHPSWTLTGLERLFRDNGDWSSVEVSSGAGNAATITMLIPHFTDLLFKRAGVQIVAVAS